MRIQSDDFWRLLAEVAIGDNEGTGDEGTGDEGAGDDGAGGAGDDDSAGGSGSGSAKTFTQADVDKIVVKRNKAVKQQLQTMERNYENLLEQQNLNEETRGQLEADLENVRKQMRTKEQQLAHEKKQAEDKYSKDLKSVSEERDNYKNLYESSTIKRELMDAAVAEEAYKADQIVSLLRNRAKLVDELTDSGEKTGNQVVRIEWEAENPETKQREVVLKSARDVVKAMKEGEDANLFKSNVVAGLGANNTGPGTKGGGKVDVTKMSPEEYAQFRKTPEGKKALGLRR